MTTSSPARDIGGANHAFPAIQRDLMPLSTFALPDKTSSALAIGGDGLVVVSGDPLICISEGREAWRTAPGRVGEPVVIGDQVVTAEARGARLTARGLARGEVRWTLAGPGWLFRAAQKCTDGTLAALRMTDRDTISIVLIAADGTVIQSLPLDRAVMGSAMRGQELVVATRTEVLGIGSTGKVLWRASQRGFGAASVADIATAPLVRATGTVLVGWRTPSGSVLHEVDPVAQTVHPIAQHVPALGHFALTGSGDAEVLASAHERVLMRLDRSHVVEVAHELNAPAAFLIGAPNGTLLVGESHAPAYWDAYRDAYGLRAFVSQIHLDGSIERWQAPGPVITAGVDRSGRVVVISDGALLTLARAV
jgi:PQQ-like domain